MARRGKRRKQQPSLCRRCGIPAEPTDFELSGRPGRWLGGMAGFFAASIVILLIINAVLYL